MRVPRLVLVFARLPRDDRHDKPLVASAAERDVEALYEWMFRRTLAVARAAGADVRLCTTGEVPASLAFPGLEIVQQRGTSFAERLERSVADAFHDGWSQVVLIGGDSPGLDASHLRDAFAALDGGTGPRAVLGPARDGGYYLLGLTAFLPSAFRDVRLGTADAGRATAEAVQNAGYTLTRLAPLRDLDGEADLRTFIGRAGALGALAARVLGRPAHFEAEHAKASLYAAITLPIRGPPTLTAV